MALPLQGATPVSARANHSNPLEVIGMTSAYPEPYQAKTSDSLHGLGLKGLVWERGLEV